MPDGGAPVPRRPLTVEAAAEHLGCSTAHIRNLIAKGRLRHFRLGRLIRIPAAALGELRAAGFTPPAVKEKRARSRKPLTRLQEIRKSLGDRREPAKRCFVYFIQAESGGLIKIGIAADPLTRLATLQAASPLRLMVLGCVRGGLKLERALHREFADERRHFEWFDPSARLIGFIAEALSAEGVSKAQIEERDGLYRSRGADALRDRLNG